MLLGNNAPLALKDSLSTYKRVTKQTPPTFIVFSTDDTGVPPENGIAFYKALKKEKIKTELHIFDHGGHGYGMAPGTLLSPGHDGGELVETVGD
jgi:acetyl esterase/lipase